MKMSAYKTHSRWIQRCCIAAVRPILAARALFAQSLPVSILIDHSQPTATYSFVGDATSGDSVSDHGGLRLDYVDVGLIFWGNDWVASRLSDQIIGSVKSMLSGPYLSQLAQYGFRGMNLSAAYTDTTDPPTIFNDRDVADEVWRFVRPDTDKPGGRVLWIVNAAERRTQALSCVPFPCRIA